MPRRWDNSEFYADSLAAKNNIKKLQKELIKPREERRYTKTTTTSSNYKGKKTKSKEIPTIQAFGPKF